MAPKGTKINVREICAYYYIVGSHLYYDKRRIHFASQITEDNKMLFFTNNGSIYIAETKMEQHPLMMSLSKLYIDIEALENFNHVKKRSNKVGTCNVCKKTSYTSSYCLLCKCLGMAGVSAPEISSQLSKIILGQCDWHLF